MSQRVRHPVDQIGHLAAQRRRKMLALGAHPGDSAPVGETGEIAEQHWPAIKGVHHTRQFQVWVNSALNLNQRSRLSRPLDEPSYVHALYSPDLCPAVGSYHRSRCTRV